MANNFNPKQLKELREVFDLFDTDNSGNLDRQEIKATLKALDIKPTDEEFDQIFKQIDTNNSDTIEWEEFLELMSKELFRTLNPKQVRECFKRFDLNGDDFITINELRTVMEKLGRQMTQKQLEDLIRQVKKDDNGIGLEEFGKLLNNISIN